MYSIYHYHAKSLFLGGSDNILDDVVS